MGYNTKRYSVYIHTNKINNKKYVGITSQSINTRWKNGQGYKDNDRFFDDIKEYGWEQFEHEIVATNLLKIDAEILEAELIEKYNSDNEEFGYNVSSGNKHISDLDDDTTSVNLTLRIPKHIKSQLEYIADKEYRTLTNVILYACIKHIEKFNESNI